MSRRFSAIFLIISINLAFPSMTKGQIIKLPPSPLDTNYIRNYYKDLVVRIYGSNKYNTFKIIDNRYDMHINYRPYTQKNIGVGFNYKFIGLNIGYAFPIFNNDTAKYGRTHYEDLQLHLYLHKFLIDFYTQFYRGFYLVDPASALNGQQIGNDYRIRPDIHTNEITVIFQYNFNYKRFSYRAAYVQDEYQKKSAGSFIAGGGISHIGITADSSFLPNDIKYPGFFNGNPYNQTSINSITANGGYAYTYVYKQRYFATASIYGGLGFNYTTLSNTLAGTTDGRLGPEFNASLHFAIGYNSNEYFVGIHYMGLITESNCFDQHRWQQVNSGNFRISVAKRFKLKRKITNKI